MARLPNNQILLSNNQLSVFIDVKTFFKENEIDFDEKVTFGTFEAAFLIETEVDCNNAAIFCDEGTADFNWKIFALDEDEIA